jgi:maltose O-acetyltransferase
MSRWKAILRYDWPLHFVLFMTNWLPDNVIFLRLRGFLARHFFFKCGSDLRLGRNVSFYNPSRIELGSHVYLAFGCVLLAGAQCISLGDEVVLGPYCVLASEDHTRQNRSFRYGRPRPGAIVVGCGSWLGAHVTVTAGSEVGQGSLVAAGAVVAGSIPENVVAGGVPAHVLKSLTE